MQESTNLFIILFVLIYWNTGAMGFPFVFIHPLSFYTSNSRILTEKTIILAGFHGARVCPYIIYHTGPQQPLSKSLSIQILTSLKLLLSSISSPGILISPTILSLTISLWWNPLKWSRKHDSGKFQWLQYHSHQLGKSHVRNTFWQTLNSMTWPIETQRICVLNAGQCWLWVSMFTRTVHLAIKSSQLWLLP